MPSGSKPGERRGGRKPGTPNKKTVVKNAIINAAARSSDLSPLEFFLSLMRQEDLDLEVRIAVAQRALPFAHLRPKGQMGPQNTNGKPSPQVNDKIGPRVEVRKVNADNVNGLDANIMPLDFLLGVMRDPDVPAHLRLRAATIVAPFVHAKGESHQVDEDPTEMRVVGDPYGFEADLVDKVASIYHDQEQLYALQPSARQAIYELNLSGGKAIPRTAAQLELESRIVEKQAALKCPPSFKELDSRQDRTRLKQIEAESTRRPLTAAEQIEQRHLEARLEVYWWTSEEAEHKKMNRLKAKSGRWCTPRTPEEERELERLNTRYGDIPVDSTLSPYPYFETEALRRIKAY